MSSTPRIVASSRSDAIRRLVIGLAFVLAAPGCGHKPKPKVTSVAEPPTVRETRPQRRKIVRIVGQPSFVESYERTSIYPKLTAFVEKWHVDIGDPVQKGQVLADLFVPEVEEDYKTKAATVELDKQKIELALTTVKVAEADVKAAAARLEAARAILEQYQAQVDRWDSEVKRLSRETKGGVVDRQVLDESRNQLRSSSAQRERQPGPTSSRPRPIWNRNRRSSDRTRLPSTWPELISTWRSATGSGWGPGWVI